ncbi:MAG: 2-hydroxyacyl-CoA dehydratase [Promethearchaeota archaeon]|jgi:benzoyl-CoA reductase/2-hydroxyglutaryl-CoA dehydratase subunit BcrC/BadD/HgdB
MFKYITDAAKIKHILSESRSSYSAFTGCFCCYFPAELLSGFNIHPVRILGYAETGSRKRDLINYMCAYLTDIINSFEADYFSWADHLIIPPSCDSLYGAKDYLEKNIDNVKTKMFRTPLQFTPDAYQVYESAVEDVLDWLSGFYSFDNELLMKGIDFKNQMNNKIRTLVSRNGEPFEGVVYLKLMIAKSILPDSVFRSLLDDISEETIEQNYKKDRDNILILGPLCDNLDLLDYIGTDHNIITKFMTSTLGLFDGEISLEGDIKKNLIRYYFSRAGTATSYNYFARLKKGLDREIKKYSIKGIIYLNYKLCDPHMFLSRQIRYHFGDSNVKVLYLEMEHVKGLNASVQNKIDTFIENI